MASQTLLNLSRRQFIKSASLAAAMFPVLPMSMLNCKGSAGHTTASQQAKIVGGGCDGCELIFEGMPQSVNWETTIAPVSEPGEPMEISGIIYQVDGKTPAANVILYVYHTDARGEYSPAPNQTLGRRHGHLRGWMKTEANGKYKFTTIKPLPYPSFRDPAHIHPTIKEADKNEYYIDEFRFNHDPLLTREMREKSQNRGGSGIIGLTKHNGVWMGRRDIILGLNVPNYR